MRQNIIHVWRSSTSVGNRHRANSTSNDYRHLPAVCSLRTLRGVGRSVSVVALHLRRCCQRKVNETMPLHAVHHYYVIRHSMIIFELGTHEIFVISRHRWTETTVDEPCCRKNARCCRKETQDNTPHRGRLGFIGGSKALHTDGAESIWTGLGTNLRMAEVADLTPL